MTRQINGSTAVAAVVGRPISHSLSPLIHNAWLAAADINGAYIALSPTEDGERFEALIEGFRGGVLRGVNVTLPFKARALALSDTSSDAARAAGAANLLVFHADGRIEADNTDGHGLIAALAAQAPDSRLDERPAVILGAGGAARGAAAALLTAGAPAVRLVNRTRSKASAIADALGASVTIYDWDKAQDALVGAGILINATSLGLEGERRLDLALDALPANALVMDMVYRPLRTPLLVAAERSGRPVVDGLEMLIQQAAPSFQAFFGRPPPMIDIRGAASAVLEARP